MTEERQVAPEVPSDFASDAEIAEMNDPSVGVGTPETAPWVTAVSSSAASREPLRAVLTPVAVAAFAAAAQAFIEGADTRGIIVAVLAVVILAAQEYGRQKVTPLARPQLS